MGMAARQEEEQSRWKGKCRSGYSGVQVAFEGEYICGEKGARVVLDEKQCAELELARVTCFRRNVAEKVEAADVCMEFCPGCMSTFPFYSLLPVRGLLRHTDERSHNHRRESRQSRAEPEGRAVALQLVVSGGIPLHRGGHAQPDRLAECALARIPACHPSLRLGVRVCAGNRRFAVRGTLTSSTSPW